MTDRESLGKYLQKERETKKISLREIADHTRVREYFLKALEEDQFHLLPSGAYTKGFLSHYAKYIGLDPKDIILRYERMMGGEPAGDVEAPPGKKVSWKGKYLYMMGGVAAAGVVALYFLIHPSGPADESIPPSPKTQETLSSVVTPQTPVTAPVPVEKARSGEEEVFSVQLKAVEKTWVSIQVDDQPEKEMLLQPGESVSRHGQKRIFLIVGNAGGVDLIFKEKPLERVGKSGEVVTLTFTPTGVEHSATKSPKRPEP